VDAGARVRLHGGQEGGVRTPLGAAIERTDRVAERGFRTEIAARRHRHSGRRGRLAWAEGARNPAPARGRPQRKRGKRAQGRAAPLAFRPGWPDIGVGGWRWTSHSPTGSGPEGSSPNELRFGSLVSLPQSPKSRFGTRPGPRTVADAP